MYIYLYINFCNNRLTINFTHVFTGEACSVVIFEIEEILCIILLASLIEKKNHCKFLCTCYTVHIQSLQKKTKNNEFDRKVKSENCIV